MPRMIHSVRLIALAVVLCASISAAALIQTDSARATGGDIRFIAGMATSEVTIYPHAGACGTDFWHCDEISMPNNTGLDLLNATGATGLASVYFQSYTYGGYGYAVPTNHIGGGSLCPGVNMAIWVPYPDSSVGTWITSIDFVQISPGVQFGVGFYIASYGWTIEHMGSVKDGNPGGGCLWDGIHLHQSGTPRGSIPYVWTNWPVETDDDPNIPGRQIYTTGDTYSNWLHMIQY